MLEELSLLDLVFEDWGHRLLISHESQRGVTGTVALLLGRRWRIRRW